MSPFHMCQHGPSSLTNTTANMGLVHPSLYCMYTTLDNDQKYPDSKLLAIWGFRVLPPVSRSLHPFRALSRCDPDRQSGGLCNIASLGSCQPKSNAASRYWDASCLVHFAFIQWGMNLTSKGLEKELGNISSHLKFFQYFVRFPAIFAKVLDLLALWAAAIVLHFSALRVQFGALGLVAHWPVLRAHARTVGVSRIEALSEFVDEAAVVHAAFPPVVIENDAVSGAPLRLVRGVILGVTHRGGRHGAQSQQEHKGGGEEEGGHPCQQNPHSAGAWRCHL